MVFLPCRFSQFVNKSPCQFIFRCILSLIGDLFVLPCALHGSHGASIALSLSLSLCLEEGILSTFGSVAGLLAKF